MYKKFEKMMNNEEIGVYKAYGISCGNVEIDDISIDEDFVDELVEILNKNDVSPIHFYDVVTDYIP